MTRSLEQRVVSAIEAAWDEGCPVAGSSPQECLQIAKRALRRWNSSARRRVKENDWEARVRDLAKGLIDFLEEDRTLVGPLKVDYRHLADKIASALRESEHNEGKGA